MLNPFAPSFVPTSATTLPTHAFASPLHGFAPTHSAELLQVSEESLTRRYGPRHTASPASRFPDGNIRKANLRCVVCQDKTATGRHYGVVTCFGCKSFWRRSIWNRRVYRCKKAGACPIRRLHHNICRACRLRKCFLAGMNPHAVQSEREGRREAPELSSENDEGEEGEAEGSTSPEGVWDSRLLQRGVLLSAGHAAVVQQHASALASAGADDWTPFFALYRDWLLQLEELASLTPLDQLLLVTDRFLAFYWWTLAVLGVGGGHTRLGPSAALTALHRHVEREFVQRVGGLALSGVEECCVFLLTLFSEDVPGLSEKGRERVREIRQSFCDLLMHHLLTESGGVPPTHFLDDHRQSLLAAAAVRAATVARLAGVLEGALRVFAAPASVTATSESND